MSQSPVWEFGYWPADKRRALPSHRNRGLEIVLVVSGEVTWHVEGRVEVVPSGSIFFTLPWETHGSVRQQEPGCELYFVVLKLDRSYSRLNRSFRFHSSLGLSSLRTQQLRKALLAAPRRSWPTTVRLNQWLPELIAEMSTKNHAMDVITALSRLVLIELQRSLTDVVHHRTPRAKQQVQHFIERLSHECHRPWTLSTMADACGLGRTRFSQILKQCTGDTPMMALNRVRVERARRLLSKSDWSITRIAMESGFSSSQYFAGVFRAYTGQSARDFQRSMCAENQQGKRSQ